MKITLNEFSGRFIVEGLPGESYPTRSAAERAYSEMIIKQARVEKKKKRVLNPPVTVSFVIGVNEKNQLGEIAKKEGLTLSKFIRLKMEKEVHDYEQECE